MKNTILKTLKPIAALFIIMLGLSFQTKAQTANVTTAYNLDKGAIEISFDLEGPATSMWNVDVALVQKKDAKVINIPANNINKSLRSLTPGKHMFEISFADLQIEGDFSTKLDAFSSGSAAPRKPVENSRPTETSKPAADAIKPSAEEEEAPAETDGGKMYTKKSKKKTVTPAPVAEVAEEDEEEETEKEEAPAPKPTKKAPTQKQKIVTKNVEPEPEETDEYIPEDNIPEGSKSPSNAASASKVTKVIKGFTVKGTSISDLSQKIKQASSELMILSDLTPVNLNLDLKKLTFKCDFVANNSNISKIGLYFGPKSTGCESCVNVIINNPGSTVLLKGSNASFDFELIGIKRD